MFNFNKISDGCLRRRTLRQSVSKVHHNNYDDRWNGALHDYRYRKMSITKLFLDDDYLYDHYQYGLSLTVENNTGFSKSLSNKVKKILYINHSLSSIKKKRHEIYAYNMSYKRRVW
jgi:hypothetical protein